MADIQRNFIAGRMNKSVDERLVPNGEYVDALNVRLGSTEDSEIGSVENAKGNERLTTLQFNGTPLSSDAKCIGALEDGVNETIYWFVHDPSYTVGATGKMDMIVSYNTRTSILTYHVISMDDGDGTNTTLNFDNQYLITGVDLIDDLLFFTDNLNPPRKINVTKPYDIPASNLDVITAEELMVIKKPPVNSPSISPSTNASDDNYLEDKFICFGYRYRYADNEYSATSQFSEPAFIPKTFEFNADSYTNTGMENFANECVITYNSGSSLVVGVDLLFKEMNDSTIKLIEKLDKEDLGLANDTEYTYTFDNKKVYTILADSEIGRLYDNVPHKAQAQTIMGNRLMYSNYKEGYDLNDSNGNSIKLEFTSELVSEDIGQETITDTTSDGDYTIDSAETITDSIVEFDLDGLELKSNSTIFFTVRFSHDSFTGDTPFPSEETADTTIEFQYILPQDFDSVYDLSISDDFVEKIGVIEVLTSGSNTTAVANKLNDGTATFLTDGVTIGSLVTNTSTNTSTEVTGLDSETQLSLKDDIFTSTSQGYTVYSSTSIRSVEDACDGNTFTDSFNCAVPNNLDSLTKTASGITNENQPINIISSPSSTVIGFQLPAMKYVDSISSPTQSVYEYYSVIFAEGEYSEDANPKSLHSNRDYEIGVVYMDEFNRASTALVSPDNTVHIPCSASDTKNSIRVNVPFQQKPPSWASRYKFVIKPSEQGYDTIYSNIFYEDTNSNSVYFLLDGENSQKIQAGDRLYVKADSSGVVNNCTIATVLEKDAKEPDFIDPPPQDEEGNDIPVIGGVYMKIKPNNFNAIFDEDSVIDEGKISQTRKKTGAYPEVLYPVNLEDPANAGQYLDYDIPANSRVKFKLESIRRGSGSACEKREYTTETTVVAFSDYDNFKDFFDGQNVIASLRAAASSLTFAGNCEPDLVYKPELLKEDDGDVPSDVGDDFCNNQLQFYRYSATGSDDGKLVLIFVGTRACGSGKNRRATVSMEISVQRAESTLVFETEPKDASDDIWYESPVSYPITNGFHEGNVQDQTASQSAIIDTEFFNCFAFGNGVESSKIRDSILGNSLGLGNRTTTVSAQDFKEADRFADITYSGLYNDESNINKLNEFNLSLLNFKTLEDTFGPVQKMVGRETDILVLQEDKISYVLQGKNLLSDSTGGGSVSSIPEVLGTQIARIENYGISFNPESYAEWGAKKFFTDAKRGAVLELIGSAANNEQLVVISEMGMRSWFRDLFIDSFNYQKLGGFDPYMKEYVLSSITEDSSLIPIEDETIGCGVSRTYPVSAGTDVTYNVNAGALVGEVTVTYNIVEVDSTINIDATYDGSTTSSGNVSTSGSFTFDKDIVSDSSVAISLSSATGNAVVEINVSCPVGDEITIIQVAVTTDNKSGEFITNQYRWTDGSFVSPLHTSQIEFETGTDTPLVSQYETVTGPQGAGVIPADGATVSIISRKTSSDDFVFDDTTDKFLYLRSNTLYNNNETDIASLLAAASTATPIDDSLAPTQYSANFTMPSTGSYLYLIWDYRTSTQAYLCYDATSSLDACCDCDCDCEEYQVVNSGTTTAVITFTDCDTSTEDTVNVIPGAIQTVRSETIPTTGASNVTIDFIRCFESDPV